MSCTAKWNGATPAESDRCLATEGNLYFPPSSIRAVYLRPGSRRYSCPWKGEAGYYDLIVNGEVNRDAAWYYYRVKKAAGDLKDYVAFDKRLGVEVAGEPVRRIDPPRTRSATSPNFQEKRER